MPDDQAYLRRAIRLAINGRGLVEPNPMVGCVIVKNNRVIGEGFHQQYGHPHAEPNALASCIESPHGATAYVTLEPCCHTNKQTPPCVPRLIAAKMSRVVVGCLDPNPAVNGKGIAQLREAGIAVDGPLLEAECKQLIAPFIASTVFKKPYVTMKWAETADGKIAGPGGRRLQISNAASSEQVQWLRSRSDAVMVGINTAIVDDPTLIPRGTPIRAGFQRIVLDRRARLPLDSMLVKTIGKHSSLVICTAAPPRADLVAAGAKFLPIDGWQKEPAISHLLIEPGPTLATSMFPQCDRLWVIRSPKVIADDTAPAAAAIPDHFIQTGEVELDGDILCEYLNTKSRVYFAPVPSADLVLCE
jgi:diaminohydroxyphosphoribosylaminopyrimidine deaminase/5-amino-6-(5-phosphoribosylamino)uracil reductase